MGNTQRTDDSDDSVLSKYGMPLRLAGEGRELAGGMLTAWDLVFSTHPETVEKQQMRVGSPSP